MDPRQLTNPPRLCGDRNPQFRHGYFGTPIYRCWQAMLNRCRNPNAQQWRRYGGRGIAVCERWAASFLEFLADVGTPPFSGASLDRIDNDGDYEPGNVRWADAKTQQRNRRGTHPLTAFGETKPLAAWVEDPRCKPDKHALWCRIARLGWPAERAITTPVALANCRRDRRFNKSGAA